jgi:hypothetical protein
MGLQDEFVEVNFQRDKVELANAELRNEIQDFSERLLMAETSHSALQQLHDISVRVSEIKASRAPGESAHWY